LKPASERHEFLALPFKAISLFRILPLESWIPRSPSFFPGWLRLRRLFWEPSVTCYWSERLGRSVVSLGAVFDGDARFAG